MRRSSRTGWSAAGVAMAAGVLVACGPSPQPPDPPTCVPVDVTAVAEDVTFPRTGLPAADKSMVSSDGRFLVYTTPEGVYRRDVELNEQVVLSEDPAFDLAVSDDGTAVAASLTTNRTVLWTAEDGVVLELPSTLRLGDIASDNSYVATASFFFGGPGITLVPFGDEQPVPTIPDAPIWLSDLGPSADVVAYVDVNVGADLMVWERASGTSRVLADLTGAGEYSRVWTDGDSVWVTGARPTASDQTGNETSSDDVYVVDLATGASTRFDTGITGGLITLLAASADRQQALLARVDPQESTVVKELYLWDAVRGPVELADNTFSRLYPFPQSLGTGPISFAHQRVGDSGILVDGIHQAAVRENGATSWCDVAPTGMAVTVPAGVPAPPSLRPGQLGEGTTLVFSHTDPFEPETYDLNGYYRTLPDGSTAPAEIAAVEEAAGLRHVASGRRLVLDPESGSYDRCQPGDVVEECHPLPTGGSNPTLSPDGELISVTGIAPGDSVAALHLLDAATLAPVVSVPTYGDSYGFVAWSPDSTYLIYPASGGGLARLETTTGETTTVWTSALYPSIPYPAIPLDVSNEGRVLFTDLDMLRSVDASGADERAILPIKAASFQASFLPDGRLAVALRDGSAYVDTGQSSSTALAIVDDRWNPGVNWLTSFSYKEGVSNWPRITEVLGTLPR